MTWNYDQQILREAVSNKQTYRSLFQQELVGTSKWTLKTPFPIWQHALNLFVLFQKLPETTNIPTNHIMGWMCRGNKFQFPTHKTYSRKVKMWIIYIWSYIYIVVMTGARLRRSWLYRPHWLWGRNFFNSNFCYINDKLYLKTTWKMHEYCKNNNTADSK